MTLMQCNINHAFFVTGTYTVDAEPRWEERRENEREREREREMEKADTKLIKTMQVH